MIIPAPGTSIRQRIRDRSVCSGKPEGQRQEGRRRSEGLRISLSSKRSACQSFEKAERGTKGLSGQNSGDLDGKSSLSGSRGELPARLSVSLLSQLLQ